MIRQTRNPKYTRGYIRRQSKDPWMYQRWDQVTKQRPLDEPEVESVDKTNKDLWIYQRWDELTRQTRNPWYTSYIRWQNKDPWMNKRWDQVTRQTKTPGCTRGGMSWPDKLGTLDITEVISGDKTKTPGCTRGGIRSQNKDPWMNKRWDQLTRQTKTSGYTRGGMSWPDKLGTLDIPEVGSGVQTNTVDKTKTSGYIRWNQVTRKT
jgi:hypothetical protein